MEKELNTNELKVLRAAILQAWDETEGEFGYSDYIKVKGLNRHQIAGYVSDLSKKGYIDTNDEFYQFYLLKKVENEFKGVKVDGYYFTLDKKNLKEKNK